MEEATKKKGRVTEQETRVNLKLAFDVIFTGSEALFVQWCKSELHSETVGETKSRKIKQFHLTI